MKLMKSFEEFIRMRIVKKQTPDIPRARFLVKESENSYNNLLEMIDKLNINDNNANIFVKSCYDILMELIRAKMLLDGYSASGFGAHEAEISYMRILGFDEKNVQFLDQIRYFRNGIVYYGTALDKEYAEKVLNFINKIYPKLTKLLEKS